MMILRLVVTAFLVFTLSLAVSIEGSIAAETRESADVHSEATVKQNSVPRGKKVSLSDDTTDTRTFPLLEKLMREMSSKLQKKIEDDFSKSFEKKLSRPLFVR